MKPFEDLNAKYDGLCERLDKLTDALHAVQNDQLHSVAYREWEPFALSFGDITDASKNLTLRKPLLANGWEGYVNRVSVTVEGASASASVATFRNTEGAANLIDWASSLLGNTPSRIVADYSSPPYFRDDEDFVAVIAGSAAVGNNVTVRVEGRRRQA